MRVYPNAVFIFLAVLKVSFSTAVSKSWNSFQPGSSSRENPNQSCTLTSMVTMIWRINDIFSPVKRIMEITLDLTGISNIEEIRISHPDEHKTNGVS